MINLSVIAGVPALGLQLVAARLVARRAGDESRVRDVEGRLMRAALVLGVGSAVALAALSPVLSHLLGVPVLTVVLLALCMVPFTVLLASQGLLQGRERFTALALVLALFGIGKILAALLAGRAGGGVGSVIALYGLALALVASAGVWAVFARAGRLRTPWVRTPTRPATVPHEPPPGASAHLARLVAAAVVPTSGLLFLASVDVLLARNHLAPADSGQYTIGAIFEKAAFWGMTFLATLFYPAMADQARRRTALIRALVMTTALGVIGIVLTAALGEPLARLVGGPAFAPLGPDLWRFAAFGVALSLVQVLAYAGVAAATLRMGVAMWVVSGAAVLWIAWAGNSVTDIVTILLLCATGLVVAGLVIERGTLLRPSRAHAPTQ